MLYDNQTVLQFLPHRDPFLFIDTVESVCHPEKEIPRGQATLKDLVGVQICAHYETKEDHAIFRGHFPGHPILPGVVQVEMMAQTMAFILHYVCQDISKLKIDVALLSVSQAKFRKPIFPNMKLEVFSECKKSRGPIITSQCKITYQNQVMSEAEIMASVQF